ncbi:MAG TPA: hypothetical protein VFP58_13025 [Candidatus Eisenbacteria bacterium]|nr:hypothetical protein [Candidatus Eisenbacteria bacterium]
MNVSKRRKALPWLGATAAVWAALLTAPWNANARPYEPTDAPTPEGDPTADDQPSPTPKGGGRHASSFRSSAVPVASATVSSGTKAKLIWLAYVRTWIRISLR